MSYNPAREIIEHNYQNKTEVENAPDFPNRKAYPVEYGSVSKAQLVHLTQTKVCSQFLRYHLLMNF